MSDDNKLMRSEDTIFVIWIHWGVWLFCGIFSFGFLFLRLLREQLGSCQPASILCSRKKSGHEKWWRFYAFIHPSTTEEFPDNKDVNPENHRTISWSTISPTSLLEEPKRSPKGLRLEVGTGRPLELLVLYIWLFPYWWMVSFLAFQSCGWKKHLYFSPKMNLSEELGTLW